MPIGDSYVVRVLEFTGDTQGFATGSKRRLIGRVERGRAVAGMLDGRRLVATSEPVIVAGTTGTQRRVGMFGVKFNLCDDDGLLPHSGACGLLR